MVKRTRRNFNKRLTDGFLLILHWKQAAITVEKDAPESREAHGPT
jgi:hypothetical protein